MSFYSLDLSMLRRSGYIPELVIGVNPDMNIGVPELIWDHQGIRATPTPGSAMYVSSDNASDTTSQILITGLDSNYKRVFLDPITLQGQTKVAVNYPGGLNWIQTAAIITTAAVGNVYVYTDSTVTLGIPDDTTAVQAKIRAGKGISRIAAFMVPDGYAAITMAIRGGTTDKSKIANVRTRITNFGQPTLETVEYAVNPDFPGLTFPIPIATAKSLLGTVTVLPSKSVLEFHADAASNGTQVFFGTDLLLVENEIIIPNED